jgi:hypothetical protein
MEEQLDGSTGKWKKSKHHRNLTKREESKENGK